MKERLKPQRSEMEVRFDVLPDTVKVYLNLGNTISRQELPIDVR